MNLPEYDSFIELEDPRSNKLSIKLVIPGRAPLRRHTVNAFAVNLPAEFQYRKARVLPKKKARDMISVKCPV